MTKTLTEQWRERTLPEGYYYTKVTNMVDKEKIMIDYYISELHHFELMPSQYVKEVIVAAPSYDEWKRAKENLIKNGTWYTERSYKRLEKKLEIATKALKKYESAAGWGREAFLALKEMEGVK